MRFFPDDEEPYLFILEAIQTNIDNDIYTYTKLIRFKNRTEYIKSLFLVPKLYISPSGLLIFISN